MEENERRGMKKNYAYTFTKGLYAYNNGTHFFASAFYVDVFRATNYE